MGAKRLKALTNIVQPEEQELSIDSIEILPDRFQTRATIDKGFVNAYANAMAKGSVFPPVIVKRFKDGRLILADGFHRVEARRKLGLRTVKAVIEDCEDETEALLRGVEANFDPFHSRKVENEDRKHAAELLIRDVFLRMSPDRTLGKYVGMTGSAIKNIRFKLSKEGVPIPERVIKVTRDGKKFSFPYAFKSPAHVPTIREHKNPQGKSIFNMTFRGKTIYLGTTYEEAERRRQDILQTRDESRPLSLLTENLIAWLQVRGVPAESIPAERTPVGGLLIKKSLFISLKGRTCGDFLASVGAAFILRCLEPGAVKVGVIGYFDEMMPQATYVSRFINDNAEFNIYLVTPEQVVAEFGPQPTPDAAPADPDPEPEPIP